MIFPYFQGFIPITPKIRVSDKNGFRILHRKIHQLKGKNILFYMTLNDNNTSVFVARPYFLSYKNNVLDRHKIQDSGHSNKWPES